MEETIVEQKDSLGKDELWVEWFNCPKCENSNVIIHSNYCSECGIKLTWKLEENT